MYSTCTCNIVTGMV